MGEQKPMTLEEFTRLTQEANQATQVSLQAAHQAMQAAIKSLSDSMKADLAEREARWEKAQAERNARWDAEFAKAEAKANREIAAMRRDTGGMGKSMGNHAEQFFIRAMQHAMRHSKSFCGIAVEKVAKNWAHNIGDIRDEYDIILHNGTAIVLIEAKYRFRMEDLRTLANRKVNNFRILFPEYADKTIYLAAAGFSFDEHVITEAKKLGIAVMQKDGKNVEIDGEGMKAF